MAEKCARVDDVNCPPTKKAKLDNENNTIENSNKNTVENADEKECNDGVYETELNLSNFQVTRVLQNNCARKMICIEGKFEGRENSAVILLEHKSFSNDKSTLKRGYFNENTVFQKYFSNDIYRNYDCFSKEENNSISIFLLNFHILVFFFTHLFTNNIFDLIGLHATVIYPATQSHIDKYKKQELYVIDETYELYEQVTLPHIESKSFSLEV